MLYPMTEALSSELSQLLVFNSRSAYARSARDSVVAIGAVVDILDEFPHDSLTFALMISLKKTLMRIE